MQYAIVTNWKMTVNYGLEAIWKEAAVVYLKTLFHHLKELCFMTVHRLIFLKKTQCLGNRVCFRLQVPTLLGP
jgi:hypothetical protein